MWGGRFTDATDKLVEEFNASVSFDKRLALQDVRGSVAHATMLAERGILSRDEADAIIGGLESIRGDITAGRFTWRGELEDVHMNIERALTERVGPVGGKLHTARSRNDQVATDFRLWLRDENGGALHAPHAPPPRARWGGREALGRHHAGVHAPASGAARPLFASPFGLL